LPNSSANVEVLEKAVKILETLAANPPSMSLQHLSAAAGLAKSSAHRLLMTWLDLGYVARRPNGEYGLGLAAAELARRVSRRNQVVELSHQTVRRLHHESGESVYLGLYRAGRVVLLDALEGIHPLRVVIDLGELCYLHASAQGRAVAAFLDPDSLAARLRASGMPKVTARTKTGWETLQERLRQVRQEGYAINWEETVEGAVCLGVPFFAGAGGPVLGSLGISIPVCRATEIALQHQLRLLRDAGQALSEVLADVPAEPDAWSRSQALEFPPPAAGRRGKLEDGVRPS